MSTGNDIRKQICSESGSVLTVWGVSLAIFMGILALTFDIGRMSTTQSELQAFADNVALAAAGELDGSEDAIERATAAANNLISDTQTFGSGDTVLSGSEDFTISFYNGLPADDRDSMTAFETTDPAEAGYVRVVANNQSVALGFAAAFASLTGNDEINNTVGAEAVAGMEQSFCDITPLMFCLPSADFSAEENIGSSVLLRAGGGGSTWLPGSFGYIDPSGSQIDNAGPCAGLSGGMLDNCLIASTGQRTGCFTKAGIDIATGQRVGSFEAALNVRFDIYLASLGSYRTDANYAPAPNVIHGYTSNGSQCIKQVTEPLTTSVGLQEDDCHSLGTCDRFGDGDWSLARDTYVNVNYGGEDPHPTAATRYDYYLAEIEAAGGASSSNDILTLGTESGRPVCSPHQSADPGRRVMVAAGVDCTAQGVMGGDKGVKVEEFFKIFMISPVGLDGTRDLWVEIIGSAGGRGDGDADESSVFNDIVRLYR